MFGLYINKMRIIEFIDRNYNIMFNKKRCMFLHTKYPIEYNDIVTYGFTNFRSLGNNWFKIL